MAESRPITVRSTKCSICQDYFNNPIRLLCLHIFCFECIQGWIYSNQPTTEFKCPNCNILHKLPPGGVGAYPSVSIPRTTNTACVDHPSHELVKFCLVCDEKVCGLCQQERHASHETGEIPDVLRDRMRIIKEELIHMDSNTEELCKLQDSIENKMDENKRHKEKHAKKVKRQVRKLKGAVDSLQNDLIARIENDHREIHASAEQNQKLAEYNLAAATRFSEEASLLAETEDEDALLYDFTPLLRLKEAAQVYELLDHIYPHRNSFSKGAINRDVLSNMIGTLTPSAGATNISFRQSTASTPRPATPFCRRYSVLPSIESINRQNTNFYDNRNT